MKIFPKMWVLLLLSCFLSPIFSLRLAAADASTPAARDEVLVIVGASGEESFAAGFATAAKNWQVAADRAHLACTIIGLDEKKDPEGAPTDKDRVQEWLKKIDPAAGGNVWIAYIGHGTFDGRESRLNLRGPDISPAELAAWFKPIRRQTIFIHGGSAGGAPFISALSGPGRIIITATRAGSELNYARFGERFAEAVASTDADIDQDGQVSLLEAFVYAGQKVQAFYADNNRMMSEHAQLDDNGDKASTPADWFKGTRLIKRPAQGQADGARSRLLSLIPTDAERAMTTAQLQQREKLEQQMDTLRNQKATLGDTTYYAQLEILLRQLAIFYVPASARGLTPDKAQR
ncbi:MAG: hypothetical protein WCL04_01235 [Verrucomicrobiota bacterium]